MYPGLPQLSKMESFAVIVNGFYPSTNIANLSILDACMEDVNERWKMLMTIVRVKIILFQAKRL